MNRHERRLREQARHPIPSTRPPRKHGRKQVQVPSMIRARTPEQLERDLCGGYFGLPLARNYK